jgi:hypothetical protein
VTSECHDSIERIEKALIGDDLQRRPRDQVREKDAELAVQESWRDFVKPILIAACASVLTARIMCVFPYSALAHASTSYELSEIIPKEKAQARSSL